MVTVTGNRAEFRFFRPQAKRVHIVGDFNGWRDGELSMTLGADGTWNAAVHLPPGDYKFRYRADGEWYIDYAAFGLEMGNFGLDSIVRIQSEQAPVAAKPEPARKPASRKAAMLRRNDGAGKKAAAAAVA